MQPTLRLVTVEKQAPLRVLCHPEMVPDNWSNRPRMAANFTSHAAAIQARYMLNREECFCLRVWKPEIWYCTEWMATCDISESGSTALMFREKMQELETAEHSSEFVMPTGYRDTVLCKIALTDLSVQKPHLLVLTWQPEHDWKKIARVNEHLRVFLSARIRAPLWWGCGGFIKWLTTNKQELMQRQHSNFLWAGCSQYNVAWIAHSRHQQLHLDFALIGAIQNETGLSNAGIC